MNIDRYRLMSKLIDGVLKLTGVRLPDNIEINDYEPLRVTFVFNKEKEQEK